MLPLIVVILPLIVMVLLISILPLISIFLSVQQVVDEHNQVHYIQLTCDGSDAGNLVHVINANLVDSVGVSSKGLDDASYAFDQNEVLNGGPLHLVHH